MAQTTGAVPSWKDVLTLAERKELLRINPLRSWWSLIVNWALIFAAMALVARWPNPMTIIVALFVIGARQLGLGIIMHEAAHRTMFETRWLNDFVGNWFAAYPIWTDTAPYRAYHLAHHARTGTDEDPDLGLASGFPITAQSMRRKVWRDLSGKTGWKQAVAVFKRDLGRAGKLTPRDLSMSRGERQDVGWRKIAPVAITNAVLLGLLTLTGYPALYLLWAVAWLTTYRLVTRIRSIAEHGMVPDRFDDMQNTRTILTRWWERLFIAPNLVNYHLEHHLLMTVPHHNLPRLHCMLRDRGVLRDSCIADGYVEVMRLAMSRPA